LTQISILGCGWLGLPLAINLINNGYKVNGSTTTIEKLEVLKGFNINPFQINLFQNNIAGDFASFLNNSEILFINIPPKSRGLEAERYINKIKLILKEVENSTIKKVIFISSTSVYKDDNSIVTEATKTFPETESGKQLIEAENAFKNIKNLNTTILRFGGLIGKDRHPVYFLSGKKEVKNPNAPINLIDQLDCIEIINSIIKKDIWNQTFNAVAPYHPTRQEYYNIKAKEFNLTPPDFKKSSKTVGKTVDSTKLITVLNYNFKNLG